jgi:SAM-dependent methyltransferase
MLSALEQARFIAASLREEGDNRRMIADEPQFASLPMSALYDMYGHASIRRYAQDGAKMASALANAIERHLPFGAPRVADWGCGLGRVFRHLPQAWRRVGFDVNASALEWCVSNFGNAEFRRSNAVPPLAAETGEFDAVIAVSVFTHLDETAALAWSAELKRVLSRGGLLLATFHAEPPHETLLADERAAFDRGEPVFRGLVREGSRLFATYTPEQYLRRRLLASFDWVEGPSTFFGQSLIVARKP